MDDATVEMGKRWFANDPIVVAEGAEDLLAGRIARENLVAVLEPLALIADYDILEVHVVDATP
jgi:hypothetical protein